MENFNQLIALGVDLDDCTICGARTLNVNKIVIRM